MSLTGPMHFLAQCSSDNCNRPAVSRVCMPLKFQSFEASTQRNKYMFLEKMSSMGYDLIESVPSEINMEDIDQNRGNRSPMTKVIMLVVLYILITFSAQFNRHTTHHGLTIAAKIHNPLEELKTSDVAYLYEQEQIYSGTWSNSNPNYEASVAPLIAQEGNFHFSINRMTGANKRQRYQLDLVIINGKYIDQGTLQLKMLIDSDNMTSVKPHANSIALTLKQGASIDGGYHFSKLLVIKSEGPIVLDKFQIVFQLGPDKQLSATIHVTVQGESLLLKIQGHEPRLMKLIAFAGVIFIVAYTPFTAALQLLKQFFDGQENPLHYSLATVTLATMWDTVVCLISFKIAFNDQESLVMFILPAFMLCLLFTNLEPRLMLLIFERNRVPGQEGSQCFSYNVLSYGSLLAIYPILILTNLNRVLFISISCLLFPQIYLNAIRGKRPDPLSSYNIKFVCTRFLLIVYLRMFPYNIFAMEPDYPLVIFCFALLILQLGLLFVQKKYGPKIVVPKWMLEPVFDYNYEEALNLEEGGQEHQCAICLISLRKNPDLEQHEPQHHLRLMKTPCKHNYHSSCLISWMKIKMECPQCRSILPPYE